MADKHSQVQPGMTAEEREKEHVRLMRQEVEKIAADGPKPGQAKPKVRVPAGGKDVSRLAK